MTLKELVTDDRSRRTRQEVPFTEIEEVLKRAELRAGTETAAALTMGYSGNVFYEWRRKGVAPLTAVFILRGYLGETPHPFTLEELCDLIKVAPTRALVAKLAKEIGNVA